MDFEKRPPLENNEGESTPEEVVSEQPENVISDEELSALQKSAEIKDAADLAEVRREMGLPTEGPNVEIPGDMLSEEGTFDMNEQKDADFQKNPTSVEDILAKAKAKGLVFEMDEDPNTPEFKEKLQRVKDERNRIKKEDQIRAADENVASLNAEKLPESSLSKFTEAIKNDDFATAAKHLLLVRDSVKNQDFLNRASAKLFDELMKMGDSTLARSIMSINNNAAERQLMEERLEEAVKKLLEEADKEVASLPGNQKKEDQNIFEKQEKISNTAGFQEAVNSGDLATAETWMLENRDKYDTRWLDHRSRELFKAHRNNGDFSAAKRMVELASSPEGVQGRKDVLAKESGMPYEQI